MRRLYLAITAAALLAAAPRAFAQAPVIETGGVQNAASNIALTSIAPQVLVTIRGQNLATSTETASGFPLPTSLGGATVTFTGTAGPLRAPLLYASPTQIDAQAPDGIAGTSVVVSTAAGSSAPFQIPVATGTSPYLIGALGIFTQDTSGCGQAVAYNVHPDGSVSLNTPQNSLDPEKDVGLTIYLTGLGALDFPDRQTGVPWTYIGSDNLAPRIASSVTFGAPGLTAAAADPTLSYLGPAPGKVGVDQANALGQWKAGPQGCKVPLSLALLQPQVTDNVDAPGAPAPPSFAPFSSTQLVDVSIRPGGGACADPRDSTLGVIVWENSTVSDVGGTSASEAVTAQFIQSEGLGFAQPGPFPPPASSPPNNAVYGAFAGPLPACNASLPNTLDAGALTVSGPGLNPVALEPSTQDGRLTYSAALAPGTLQGGTYQVAGQGGSQVGAFTANASIPAPIMGIATIASNFETSSLQPGTQLESPCQIFNVHPIFPCQGQYTFTWTGGDNRSIVTVQFIVGNRFQAVASSYGGPGNISVPESYGAYPLLCGDNALLNYDYDQCTLMPEGSVEAIITQTPFNAPSQAFSAPGLGFGGESTWKYVWDFRGLTN
ncbi:MAG: hypothetical protein ABSF64_17865 [Bryobacteraceae bacterium]|jgi:uncharacterized protein (TIGR03437 family)